jgi:hypothetical protein
MCMRARRCLVLGCVTAIHLGLGAVGVGCDDDGAATSRDGSAVVGGAGGGSGQGGRGGMGGTGGAGTGGSGGAGGSGTGGSGTGGSGGAGSSGTGGGTGGAGTGGSTAGAGGAGGATGTGGGGGAGAGAGGAGGASMGTGGTGMVPPGRCRRHGDCGANQVCVVRVPLSGTRECNVSGGDPGYCEPQAPQCPATVTCACLPPSSTRCTALQCVAVDGCLICDPGPVAAPLPIMK